MQLFYCPGIRQGATELPHDEAHHCIRVLRKQPGDIINLTDGEGTRYTAIIDSITKTTCVFSVTGFAQIPHPPYQIHIALAPTKNIERMEWFVEKAVEIGIDRISLITTDHSERPGISLDRLKRKAISAMKQSERASLPMIGEVTPLKKLLPSLDEQQRFIAHLSIEKPDYLNLLAVPESSYVVLIGPEGGFSTDEITSSEKFGFLPAKLGEYRLRTETAALMACSLLHAVNQR